MISFSERRPLDNSGLKSMVVFRERWALVSQGER